MLSTEIPFTVYYNLSHFTVLERGVLLCFNFFLYTHAADLKSH